MTYGTHYWGLCDVCRTAKHFGTEEARNELGAVTSARRGRGRMTKVGISIQHNGQTWSAEVMRVRSTSLGMEDHGIWTANLHCEGSGTGTSVGGYCLDDKPDAKFGRRIGSAYGLDWLMEVCRVVGVEKWESLPQKAIYVLYPKAWHWGQVAKGIANIDTGEALIFEEHSQLWQDAQ